MMRKRGLAVAVLLPAAAGMVCWAGCRRQTRAPEAADPAAYAPYASCAGCHQEIWKSYQHTGMAKSFAPFRVEESKADFESRNRFHHRASDRHYRMERRGGEAFMRRHQVGFGGVEHNVTEKRIDYVLGSGHKAQTFLHRNARGELIQLPVAWYTENGGYWAMNPSYDRPDHEDFRRRIRYDCFFCHNAYPGAGEGSDSFYGDAVYREPLPEGIDCQRCHGPGRAHVEAAAKGAPAARIRALIVNPARLEPARQMELCMQCHLQTTSRSLPYAVTRMDRGVFSYRPGEPLANYILHFDHPAGSGFDDKFEIAHAAYRLRQSACFVKSGGTLTCTGCHNPHQLPRGEEAAALYSRECMKCHGEAVGALLAEGKHPSARECIGCHMPQRRTEDVVHVVMTDHKIQRKPAANLTAPRRETPETAENSYRGPVSAYYPERLSDSPEDRLHFAVAQVRAGANPVEGLRLFEEFIGRYPPARAEPYYELAEAYRRSSRRAKAFAAYQESLRRDPDFLPSLRSFGMELSAAGQLERGAEMLKRALRLSPGDPRTLHDLGLNLARQGRGGEAVAAFRQALAGDPDSPETHNALAAELYASGDAAGAEAGFREAIRARPDYGMAHANLASLIVERGSASEAEFHFRKAVQLAPDYAKARYDYGVLLAAQRRLPEATALLEGSVALEPRWHEAHFMLASVLAAQGKLRQAIPHFETAAVSPAPAIRQAAEKALAGLRGVR